ncbi:MAG: porin [Myxococcota bacterium]|nr:porin [Myxococcota bacterium]
MTHQRTIRKCSILRAAGVFALLMVWPIQAIAQEAPTEAPKDAPQEATKPKGLRARVALLETQISTLDNTLREIHGKEAPAYLRTKLVDIQSKLDGVAVRLAQLHQLASESITTANEHEAHLDDIAAEVISLGKEIEKHQSRFEAHLSSPPAGYDNGFFLRSLDDKFVLQINGFVRPYYRFALQKEWKSNAYGQLIGDAAGRPIGGDVEIQEHTFGVANARLAIQTRILSVILGKVEIDYGTRTGTVQFPVSTAVGVARYSRFKMNEHSVRFLDVYAVYAPFSALRIKAGQFKVPFDVETSFDANWLTFPARSLMTRAYPRWGEGEANAGPGTPAFDGSYEIQRASSFGRDLGLEISGSIANQVFKYAVGVFNGSGGSVANDNRDVLVALRFASDPLGPMTRGMSDLTPSKRPLLSIGGAFAYDLPAHQSAGNPGSTYNSSDVNLTGDVHFKWQGVSALGAVFYRQADHGAVMADKEPIDTLGMMVQFAYFNASAKLEPAYRYSVFDPDLDVADDHVHEHSLGLSYYPYKDNLKVQVQYRGLFPTKKERSYFLPRMPAGTSVCFYDNFSEITIMAQVAF